MRARLADQLGVEPGPVLRNLEVQVLRQNPSLGGGLRAPLGRPGNLPALTSVLVGRKEELATLSRLLRGHRLLTVAGPAGVGKTRTAIELAGGVEPPGGVWLVRLDGVDSAASVPEWWPRRCTSPAGKRCWPTGSPVPSRSSFSTTASTSWTRSRH